MKTVLIALDYSPTAQEIAQMGYSVAQSICADVVLVHIILDLSHYAPCYLALGTLQLDSVDYVKDASLAFLDRIKDTLGDETIQLCVGEGDCADSILMFAQNKHVDFIVIGTHSHSWFENSLMGSVTKSVLRQSTIPLLIIPTKKTKENGNKPNLSYRIN